MARGPSMIDTLAGNGPTIQALAGAQQYAAHDVSGEARDDHGRWMKGFIDWHEQAGRTANSKSHEQHQAEAEEHRQSLMKLPISHLKRIAEHVGHFSKPGTAKDKFVAGLLSVVATRRGMAQRTEQ